MPHIVLTEEQARIIAEAKNGVEVRDPEGEVVAFLKRLSPEETARIAEATSSGQTTRQTAEEQEPDPRRETVSESPRSRKIAVAYEEVVLPEEDAELLRQMREVSTASAGKPARPPRRIPDR